MFKLITAIIVLLPTFAHAYLGPGIGGGIIAATLGLVIAIFAAIFGILWFPIKRLIKKRKEAKQQKKPY